MKKRIPFNYDCYIVGDKPELVDGNGNKILGILEMPHPKNGRVLVLNDKGIHWEVSKSNGRGIFNDVFVLVDVDTGVEDEKALIRGAACAIATIIQGHGFSTECRDAFMACIGSWSNFISADPDDYDIRILSEHFKRDDIGSEMPD